MVASNRLELTVTDYDQVVSSVVCNGASSSMDPLKLEWA